MLSHHHHQVLIFFQANRKDPLNVHSDHYKKWEQWFFSKFPSNKTRLQTNTPINRINLTGPQLVAIVCLIQAIVIKLVFFTGPTGIHDILADPVPELITHPDPRPS